MRQALVVTFLLCILAIPATLLVGSAPVPPPARSAAARTDSGSIFAPSAESESETTTAAGEAVNKGLMTLATWIASRTRGLPASAARNPIVFAAAAPSLASHVAVTWFHAAKEAAAKSQPIVVGSIAPKVAPTTADKPIEALRYALAANPADDESRYGIGMAYLSGDGAAPDYAEAAHWFLLAAEHGHARAALALADLYIRGEGVQRNYPAAYMWLDVAARGLADDTDRVAAIARRDRVEASMTPDERTLAETAIRNWKPVSVAMAEQAPAAAQ